MMRKTFSRVSTGKTDIHILADSKPYFS